MSQLISCFVFVVVVEDKKEKSNGGCYRQKEQHLPAHPCPLYFFHELRLRLFVGRAYGPRPMLVLCGFAIALMIFLIATAITLHFPVCQAHCCATKLLHVLRLWHAAAWRSVGSPTTSVVVWCGAGDPEQTEYLPRRPPICSA